MKITAITRYKHHQLYQALKKLGWTQTRLAEESGVSLSNIGNYVNLRRRPSQKHATMIMMAFAEHGIDVDVYDGWPNTFKGLPSGFAYEQSSDVPISTLLECNGGVHAPPTQYIELKEEHEALRDVIKTLTSREQSILIRFFGLFGSAEMSLTEIAKEDGYGLERIRQLRNKALRKLRHPERLEELKKATVTVNI